MNGGNGGIITTIGTGVAVIGLMWTMLSGMESRFNARMDRMEARFNSRMERMENRFNARFDRLEDRVFVLPDKPKH